MSSDAASTDWAHMLPSEVDALPAIKALNFAKMPAPTRAHVERSKFWNRNQHGDWLNDLPLAG